MFGDGVFKGVTELNGVLIQSGWDPYKKRNRHQGCWHRGTAMGDDGKRQLSAGQGKEASRRTSLADTLVLGFQLCADCGVGMAARADKCRHGDSGDGCACAAPAIVKLIVWDRKAC